MPPLRSTRHWRPPPLVLAIAATIGAAGLVLYLQQRAMTALQAQNRVIVRQLAEQTASDIAQELRHTLDGPIFDTLAAVNHPELQAGRLDLVAQQFARGLEAYPHVDRFFAWIVEPGQESSTAADVLFYGRDGRFVRDPELGAELRELAQQYAGAQQIYAAVEHVGNESRQAFLRLFWTDARRVKYFAVLGFVIDPASMRARLFTGPRARVFDDVLLRRGTEVPLQLRISDEHGALVYGTLPRDAAGARLNFPMLFYPAEDIRSRLAAEVAPQPWTIDVGAAPFATTAVSDEGRRYWPIGLSMLLMLAALGLTVQAHRRSTELARMQNDFVAHVSHQLKTPLSLLSAATETLRMDRIRSPERMSEYLDTIHAEAARLSALVTRVLEYSRVQQQRNFEFEQVDLGELVHETVDAFAHGLGQPDRFEVAIHRPGPFVRADPAALEQAVVNLLDNAIKYSDPDQVVSVTVRAERLTAMVEVTDRGVGIAPADHERIFERFYRVPGGAHRQGFGLGLPIVRELVHAHGGRVEVSSTLGAGSTFRLTLRCVPAPHVGRERAVEHREAAS